MKFRSRKKHWYVAKLNGNRGLPDAQQTKALIVRPDQETKNELTQIEVVRDLSRKAGATGTRRPAVMRRKADTGRILREFVPEIVNCEVEEEDEKGNVKTIKIKTGAALAESSAYGIDALTDELCVEVLRDELDEDGKKNSASA